MSKEFEYENDWKLFTKRLPLWQERYMGRLLREYAEIIASDASIADRFWTLEKRITSDKEKNGVALYRRRSTLFVDVIKLIEEGAIDFSDLEGFSREFVHLIECNFDGSSNRL